MTLQPADKADLSYVSPRMVQLAALCWRPSDDGRREVLLVTSSTGRWILPKGWPMTGKTEGEAAMIEAWEEAGVAKGKVADKPLGGFIAAKITDEGDETPYLARVYPIKVTSLAETWPEMGRRSRRWLPLEEAADVVSEDGLREILLNF